MNAEKLTSTECVFRFRDQHLHVSDKSCYCFKKRYVKVLFNENAKQLIYSFW